MSGIVLAQPYSQLMWGRRDMFHECRTSSKNRRAIILIIINVIGVNAFPLQFFVSGIKDSSFGDIIL